LRRKKLDFMKYFDLLIPYVAMAQGFGRIGCFLAGCCYGAETECFLSVTFHNSPFAPNGVSLIPTQLYSSPGDFLIMAVLLLYAKKQPARGKVAGLYMILYSVGRFIIEFFRADYRGAIGFLSTSQFILIFSSGRTALFFNIGHFLKTEE
jgi:phosphatidylglycerol:prolipoprotein diacylglycerol transferase